MKDCHRGRLVFLQTQIAKILHGALPKLHPPTNPNPVAGPSSRVEASPISLPSSSKSSPLASLQSANPFSYTSAKSKTSRTNIALKKPRKKPHMSDDKRRMHNKNEKMRRANQKIAFDGLNVHLSNIDNVGSKKLFKIQSLLRTNALFDLHESLKKLAKNMHTITKVL